MNASSSSLSKSNHPTTALYLLKGGLCHSITSSSLNNDSLNNNSHEYVAAVLNDDYDDAQTKKEKNQCPVLPLLLCPCNDDNIVTNSNHSNSSSNNHTTTAAAANTNTNSTSTSTSTTSMSMCGNNDNPKSQDSNNNQKCWIVLNNHNTSKITEISGEAGSGKSQLCLSLCVSCAMMKIITTRTDNDRNNIINNHDYVNDYYHAMYITMGSEGNQPLQIAHRLHQMVQHRLLALSSSSSSKSTRQQQQEEEVTNVMKRIHTNHVHNEEDLVELVTETLPTLLQQQQRQQCNIQYGLIVLDSIAGIFRIRDDHNNNDKDGYKNDSTNSSSSSSSSSSSYYKDYYAKRSEVLFKISSQLKKIAFLYNLHVVIVNQVTTAIATTTTNATTSASANTTSTSHATTNATPNATPNATTTMMMMKKTKKTFLFKPALGLAWSYCVNDRYVLSTRRSSSSSSSSSSHDYDIVVGQNFGDVGGITNNNSSSNNSNNNININNNSNNNSNCNNQNNHEHKHEYNNHKDDKKKNVVRTMRLLASSTYSIQDKEVNFEIKPAGVFLYQKI